MQKAEKFLMSFAIVTFLLFKAKAVRKICFFHNSVY